MSNASAQAVKELREMTGLGMMECKKILEEAGGDASKAKELVAKRALDKAGKLAERAATEGIVEIYLHHDHKLGVMVELNCNTDFVARGEAFRGAAKEIAVHIAATSPQVIRREELDQELVASVRQHYASEVDSKKPPQVIEKIVDGRMNAWFAERVLLDQPWVKDDSKTIGKLVQDLIATTKENVTISRFARFKVGEAGSAEPAKS